MRCLKLLGYQVISLRDAHAGLFGSAPLPKRPVVLTFDDGFQDFHDHAYPILREFGYSATVFVVAGLLSQPPRWLTDVEASARIMSGTMLRTVRQGNIEIGAHTMSHPHLPHIPVERQEQEIALSKTMLEDTIGEAVSSFAYPYGSYDAPVRDLVMGAGFETAVTINRGLANWAANPFEIPRKAISWGDNLVGFLYKLLLDNQFKRRPKTA